MYRLIAGAAAITGLTGGALGWLGASKLTRPKVEKLAKAFNAAKHRRGARGRWIAGGALGAVALGTVARHLAGRRELMIDHDPEAARNTQPLTAKFTRDRDPRGRFAAVRRQFPRPGDPPRITLLVGMPGSGKSTWRAMAMAQGVTRPTTVISSDDHVEAIARQKGIGFSEAFKLLDHKAVDRTHNAQIRAAVAAGHDIIVDKINASPKARARTLRRVPQSYERHAVHLVVPESVLRTRRAMRPGKVIPRHALREMATAFKPPAMGEFDYIHQVVQHHGTIQPGALAKASPDSSPDESSPEATMAGRLAALFGTWTDGAEGKMLAPSATTMHADMVSGLEHALQPLDQVTRDGITQAIPVATADGGAEIAFTLQARSPAVKTYVDHYRQSRVVALADEQREMIKGQLLDAATAGADPQAMATRIKQTIGLTPFQAGHVMNYLHELEDLNPAALQRQLRDRRFDSTIQRAMEDGTVLPADYIQKVVDAYHRRYLAFRATTIANTEAVGAANNGQAAAALSLQDEHPDFEIEKEWIATDDERTRHDHASLNGTVVRGLQTPFVADSGDLIRWPHDPTAPARQVIRCRCSWVTRLVPKARVAATEQ